MVLPWSSISPRWGHPWHKMCSYLGSFPPALARSFILMLTEPGGVVLDPFSGRGTTLLEARLLERVALASDLNPIALALSSAKAVDVTHATVLERVAELQASYDPVLYVSEAQVQAENILLIYHHHTLAQLCFLRHELRPRDRPEDAFLVGLILGIMHGSERADGSSGYASISMPNTFSMSPSYVRNFVAVNRLRRVQRDVFGLIREKAKRLFSEPPPPSGAPIVAEADARRLTSEPLMKPYVAKVDLLLGSPPYLGVVNYAKQNWIRSWFLKADPEHVSEGLADDLTLSSWLEFMTGVVHQVRATLSPDGVAALVIGDVAKSSRSVIPLAREFIRHVRHLDDFSFVGCLADRLDVGDKTTRIWKDTKGKATSVDRVVFLSNRRPNFNMTEIASFSPKASALEADRLEQNALEFAGT